MTLQELIQRFRVEANDEVAPHFFSDQAVTDWLNDAVEEAAIRGRLIHESSSASVCRITVKAGVSSYRLHPSLYEIDHIAFIRDGQTYRQRLHLTSSEVLDSLKPRWRDEQDDPEYALQTDTRLRLAPEPLSPGVVVLEGYRLPMGAMEDGEDSPEIHPSHHRHLVDWALHRGFGIPDTESFDPSRSAKAEDAFTRYFGARPDSDLRRITREDVPHHVTACWP